MSALDSSVDITPTTIDLHQIKNDITKLPEMINAHRRLPTRCYETLKKMIEEKDQTLIDAIEGLTGPMVDQQPDDIREAIFKPVVTRMEKEWLDLFSEYPTDVAKQIAQDDKKTQGKDGMCLVYGEVSFVSIGTVLCTQVDMKPGGVFYDLGSGTGRGVIAASLLHNFEASRGIELMTGLYNASTKVKSKFESNHADKNTKIELTNGDLREVDWSDGDLLFANSTCFDEDLMKSLAKYGEKLKTGSYFITFTKKLPSAYFKVIHSRVYQMSWGGATVYVQVKLDRPITE